VFEEKRSARELEETQRQKIQEELMNRKVREESNQQLPGGPVGYGQLNVVNSLSVLKSRIEELDHEVRALNLVHIWLSQSPSLDEKIKEYIIARMLRRGY
jgi:hypothetical protein